MGLPIEVAAQEEVVIYIMVWHMLAVPALSLLAIQSPQQLELLLHQALGHVQPA
jgi:hypothetical protein